MNPATDKCIPVIKNGVMEEVSIQEALIQARDIEAICLPMPVEHALINMLSAAVSHMLAIDDRSTLKNNYNRYHDSGLPSEKVIAYFQKYSDRFELFKKPKKGFPLYQPYPTPEAKEFKNIGGLIDFFPSGNNKIFVFSADPELKGISQKQSFYSLLAFQTFNPAGGGRGIRGLPNRSAPIWSRACSFVPKGRSLYETIFFNIDIWTDFRRRKDLPSWARSSEDFPEPSKERPIDFKGPLDRATFPHHYMVLQAPKEDGLVWNYAHASSYVLPESFEPVETAIIEIDTPKGKTAPKARPLHKAYSRREGPWQKRFVLIQQADNPSFAAPKRLTVARDLLGLRDSKALLGVDMLHIKMDSKSVMVKSRVEQRIDVPVATSAELSRFVSQMAVVAEKASSCLRSAVKEMLSGKLHDPKKKEQKSDKDRFKVATEGASKRLMGSLGVAFESAYLKLLNTDTGSEKEEVLTGWISFVARTTMDFFERSMPAQFSVENHKAKKRLYQSLLHNGIKEKKEVESGK